MQMQAISNKNAMAAKVQKRSWFVPYAAAVYGGRKVFLCSALRVLAVCLLAFAIRMLCCCVRYEMAKYVSGVLSAVKVASNA
jgi:hypothetical protein